MSSQAHDSSQVTSEIASALHNSKALKFGSFQIKSGVLAPYYIDLTWLLSSPQDFSLVIEAIVKKIKELMVSREIDKLASIELKGALILPSVASKLNLPCVVVRKQHKEYGLTGRIAGGTIVEGETVLFLDDVISSGMSKLEGITPLREMGARVEDILVVVDREQGGRENMERAGYKLHALTKTTELMKRLLQSHHISTKKAETVLKYVKARSPT